LPRRCRGESGFTIVEVLVAMFILLIAAGATFKALAAATDNTQRAKESQVLLDVAQQEMEKVRNIDYSQIALTSSPGTSASSLDPDSRVSGGTFALNRDGSSPAVMVVNGGSLYGGGFVSGGTLNPGSVVSAPLGVGDVNVRIWRFVVWQNDAQCGTCGGNQDYKRVVIAVRVEQRGNQNYQRPYIEIQSDFIDPQKSTLTDPAAGPGGVVTAQQFWLTDTPCAAAGTTSRANIAGDHLLHNTLGTCASGPNTGTTAGSPDTLLTSGPPDPAPDDVAVPAVFDYSNDFYLEPSPNTDKGVQLKRPTTTGCNYSPSGSNPESQIHRWVTDKFASNFNMTGKVTLEFYTRAINDASYSGKLCVWLFKRRETGTPPVALDTALLDSVLGNAYWTYSQSTWPRLTSSDPLVWTKVRLTMNFNPAVSVGGQALGTLVAGDRLGVALGSERTGTTFDAGIQVLYDHPNYPTRIEVDTTTPIDAG
jgi:prepilin-type N-terminal cleavage/methylation domain-containing protein